MEEIDLKSNWKTAKYLSIFYQVFSIKNLFGIKLLRLSILDKNKRLTQKFFAICTVL